MQAKAHTYKAVFIAAIGAGLLGLATTASARPQVPKSQQILKCLAANVPDHGGIATLAITSRSATGTTTRYRWRLYWRSREGQRAAVIRVIAPAAVAGSAYLVRDTENGRAVYLYSPAVGAVRRIRVGQGGSREIFGTEIALRDVLGVARILANGTLSYMGEKNLHGRTMDWMLALPPPDSNSPYSRVSMVIGHDPCVIWRVAFSKNGTRSKVYTAAPQSLRQTPSGLWYPAKWTLRTGDGEPATTIRITELATSPDFASGRFQPDSFYQ